MTDDAQRFLSEVNSFLCKLDQSTLSPEVAQRLTRHVSDTVIMRYAAANARISRWANKHPRHDIVSLIRESLANCRIFMSVYNLANTLLSDHVHVVPPSDFYRYTPWAETFDRNNCYAFAIDDFSVDQRPKSGPGDASPVLLNDCKDMMRRLSESLSHRRIRRVDGDPMDVNPFHARRYLIRMDVAEEVDFHFYKEAMHKLVRVDGTPNYVQLSREYKVPVEFLVCANKPLCSVQMPPRSVLVCIPLCFAMYQKNGYALSGPKEVDACGAAMRLNSRICQNYGDGLNYKLACGFYTLNRQPTRLFLRNTDDSY